MTFSELFMFIISYSLGDDIYEYTMNYLNGYLNTLSGNQVYTYYDKNGIIRRKELRSVIDNLTRGISGFVHSELMEEEADLIGAKYFLLSAHIDCSVMCRNDQGTVVARERGDRDYKSLHDAIMDGFYHYGTYGSCRHHQSPYVEGFSQIPESWGKWTEKQMDQAYKREQMKRYNERMIRKYKREKKDELVKKWMEKPHDKFRIY